MRVLELAGQNAMLRFLDVPGSGTPLVFIHGLGCASSCDYPQVIADPALTGRRSILVDLLGSAYSDRLSVLDIVSKTMLESSSNSFRVSNSKSISSVLAWAVRSLSSLQRWRLARGAGWFSQRRTFTRAEGCLAMP